MPLLSILIGLFCGMVVWVVLDQVQPRALRQIFSEELNTRLDQQARETLIRFENYVTAHTSATRLLSHHRQLSSYLEPIYWFDNDDISPVIYYENPPWLPSSSLWRPLIRPSYILLLDRKGRTREIFNVGDEVLPGELLTVDELFLDESRVRAYLTRFQDKPYLLVSDIAEDATDTSMGYLMVVAPIESAFLNASQQGVSAEGVVVGLLDADEQRFLTSSDPYSVLVGDSMEEVAENYLVTAQSFFEYGSDFNIQFATMVLRSVVEATSQRVAGVERRQRVVAAVTFITVFTLVFYLLSERLNRMLRRMSRFSRLALGGEQPVIESGNQVFVVEDWIRQFIRQVRKARDEMRLEHESEMQESEALKHAITEAALDAVISIDESGQIIEFNHTAEEMFDHRRMNVIEADFQSLIIEPGSYGQFQNLLAKFSSVQGPVFTDARSEMEARRADNSAFPVEVAIKPIQLKDRMILTVYMHDISNRKRAEQEIYSLAKFPSESPSPVLRVNRLGVITYANPASDLLVKHWGCEQGQTLPQYWRRRVADVLESGKDSEIELTCDQTTYSLLMAPVPGLEYVNIYGRDITDVHLAEQQARQHQQELVHVSRLSTMGEMATGLAHELNQPLSAIANYANGCTRRLKSGDGVHDDLVYALSQISSQADRAGEIIRRLRSLVAKQPPVRKVADINDLVREVNSFVVFDARKSRVVIEQELSLEHLLVRVDVVQIEQVLLNLLRNALDALNEVPEPQRRLAIRTSRLSSGSVLVEVDDSGSGIDAEAAVHLFEPFFTTKETGMGMGLVISQTIVEDHSGQIVAEPLPEGGSRFSVTLPGYQVSEDK
ncbi:MAG: PAS domain S-box protein [Gammaproteobacteria bacterium]|nr:PAS domain S-box protein [Gammaproteobacteria bacterium]